MDGLKAINNLNELQSQLNSAIDLYGIQGNALAEKERDYNIALRNHATIMQANGETATFINLTVKGVEEVANCRFERDLAKARYETTREKINALKYNIRILEGIIEREWGRA